MSMVSFLSGAAMMGYFTAALFFFRFWEKTQDRLFAIFAFSFLMLSVERWVLLLMDATNEARTWIYVIRLLAFVLILYGIVDKNKNL